MKRLTRLAVAAAGLALVVNVTAAHAQGTFKIPFEFKAGGKKLAAGQYSVAQKGDGQIVLRKEPGGAEIMVPFTERLAQPAPPVAEPQLVFDEVGDFAPSYTEYMTVYVLAEVWLPGEDGFLIHTTKGAHKNKIIKGQSATK
ncbi:MAG: hypothetical protein A2W03_12050 [Candidatus Aminicenantes bacterium RBG_16_63_16]|nr:MAG: hypothetical protein A2W03_12050 [Candidatus Aminicenantes bacterium RBG_16_63_16]